MINYTEAFDKIMKMDVESLHDKKFFKDLLTTKLAMMLKEVQFAKQSNTEFNYGRLWETANLLDIFTKVEKQEEREIKKQKKNSGDKRTFR